MNFPEDLSPETLTWFRVQMSIATARAIEPIKAEMRAQEDFCTGLLIVLIQVVPDLLKQAPELASRIAPQWRNSAHYYEDLEDGLRAELQGSLDLHEARKLIFDACVKVGVWPATQAEETPTCYAPPISGIFPPKHIAPPLLSSDHEQVPQQRVEGIQKRDFPAR